jgi:glucose/arabinose dehydrogenase
MNFRFSLTLLLATVLLLSQCRREDPAQPSDPTPDPTAPATLNVTTLVGGLDTPWSMARAADGRLFVTERPGRVRVVENGQLRAQPWAEVAVNEQGEAGLLGIALDPNFATNGYVYLAYTYARTGASFVNRLVRYREDAATRTGAVDRILIDDVLGNSTHNGGVVKFGPDGKLYWGTGDRQVLQSSQDPAALTGKILRLNPDGSIPADNPTPTSYVFSLGHRNPQGLAWRATTLYSTEHGPSGGTQGCCNDELNRVEPGKNYGWPLIWGNRTQAGLEVPLLRSGDSETWAPGGLAAVTAGKWQGSLVFAGLRGQGLYRAVFDAANPAQPPRLEKQLDGQYGRLRDVLALPDGTLYVAVSNRDGRGTPRDGDDRILVVKID